VIPPDVTKNIITSVAQIKAPASSTSSQTAQGGSTAQAVSTTALVSNSGLTTSELNNSVDASQFVSAITAQNFKNSLLNSLNTQTALNGNPDTIPVSVLNDAIRNNPAVWAGILVSMGMPPDTPVPDAQKQSALAQYINSDFAKYYALLVFPKVFSPYDIQNGVIGPLGAVTFSTGNIAMACTAANGCGTNASATINSQTVVMNYSAAQVTNTFNVSYANFYGISGSATGSATSSFSSLSIPGGSGPRLNIALPGDGTAGSGGTTLGMVGQFGSIGNLIGKWSTLTTSLAAGSNPNQMRAGYQVKGQ
jgi:hypothetical protein